MSELTKRTTQKMFKDVGVLISTFEGNAYECARQIVALESLPKTDELNALRGILKTSLMLDFINLDLCAAYRQYLSTELSAKYEKRQAMNKINIVMSEGFKKIYGFESKGDKQRKKSFWRVQIKTTVDYLGRFNEEYNEIEEKLKEIANSGVFNREMRNLAVHYDVDPMKVYKMLSELDGEEVTRRCRDFYTLLNRVAKFVVQLSCAMASKVSCSSQIIYSNNPNLRYV